MYKYNLWCICVWVSMLHIMLIRKANRKCGWNEGESISSTYAISNMKYGFQIVLLFFKHREVVLLQLNVSCGLCQKNLECLSVQETSHEFSPIPFLHNTVYIYLSINTCHSWLTVNFFLDELIAWVLRDGMVELIVFWIHCPGYENG